MPRPQPIDLSTIDMTTLEQPAKGERRIHDAITAGLALRFRDSGAMTWVVRARAANGWAMQSLGDARLIPLDVARRMAMQAGETISSPPKNDAAILAFDPRASVGDIMPHFLASGEKGRWKKGTLRMMEAVSRSHILPAFGARRVRDLTPEDVARWHLDVSAKTTSARMALSTLSGLMLYAEDHGLRDVGTNPCKGLRKKQRGHRGQALPATVIRRLWGTLDRLQERLPDACDVVRLLLLTGARRGEILSFEWERIVGPRAILADSKTGPRTIWLNAHARAILAARKAVGSGGLVFPALRSEGPMKTLERDWSIIRKEAGIGSLRLHNLRHHYASVGVSNGIDLRVIGQLLGHHDLDSTLVYAHLTSTALDRSATRVSGVIDRALRGETKAARSRTTGRSGARQSPHMREAING